MEARPTLKAMPLVTGTEAGKVIVGQRRTIAANLILNSILPKSSVRYTEYSEPGNVPTLIDEQSAPPSDTPKVTKDTLPIKSTTVMAAASSEK